MTNRKRLILLEALVDEEPRSLMSRLRAAMPAIEAGLKAGHTLRTVHERLNQEGLEISYRCLVVYRRRILRKMAGQPSPTAFQKANAAERVDNKSYSDLFDPLANLREQETKANEWKYPSGPPNLKGFV